MRTSTLILVAAVALAPPVLALWPHLPPLHEDEILPLVPLFLLKKVPEAYGSAFLAGCPHALAGVPLPLTSYVIEGPLKALPYALAYPFTRWAYTPAHLIGFYRTSNLVWTGALFGGILLACAELGGTLSVALVTGLLASDVALVYLGVTDLGRPLHLLAGVALALLLATHAERPRWRALFAVAVVVFLGEWNRADFLWFMVAGLAGLVAAGAVTRPSRWPALVVPVLMGYALGLVPVALLVPEYFRYAADGSHHRIPLDDLARLGSHLATLLYAADPLGSFQRHFDVSARIGDAAYVVYRRVYVALVVMASMALGIAGVRARRPGLLVLAAFPVGLLVLVVVTAETYLVHHILVVKPFLYVALAVVAARAAAAPRWRVPVLAAWLALVVGAAAVQVQALGDLAEAPTATGIYGVTWNMSRAWAAAARSGAPVVIAVDFGVWVPGALASPADQRWESTAIPDDPTLDALMAGRERLGMVLRANGPDAWLLEQHRYAVAAHARFDEDPGDPWAFVLLQADARPM